MKPFRDLKQAIEWANRNTDSPRWVDIVVKIGPNWFRLQTTHIAYPTKLVTRATQVFGSK